MTCSQSCWSLHFLLTNTDAHPDSGHQSFSLLWATLRAIRRFKNEQAHKILTLSYQRCQSCISCMRACVCQLCGMWVWLAIRLFTSSTILMLKLVMNYFLQSFPSLFIERRTVVSHWQNPTPGHFVSIRWEQLGVISLPSPPINWEIIQMLTQLRAHMTTKTQVRF